MATEPHKPQDAKSDSKPAADLIWLNRVFLTFIALALLAIWLYAPNLQHASTAWLWAFACLAAGAFVGLLFGIKREQSPSPARPPDPKDKAQERANDKADPERYQPNNNLIDVSDWLTKIIVGVGLIELRQLPDKMRTIARPLSTCLGGDCGLAVAVAVIVFFGFAGFLVGYINSRTFLAAMFRGYDDYGKRLEAIEGQVEKTSAKQEVLKVEADVQLQGMRNRYTGDAATAGQPEADQPIPAEPDSVLLQMARAYQAIQDPDYAVRVAKKDRAASEMLRYVFEKKLSKAALQAWALAQPMDGLILTLASTVLAFPEEGDLARLLSVGKYANWLHTKYRVALALRALAKTGFGPVAEWNEALALLDRYADHAKQRGDEALSSLAAEVGGLVKSKHT